MNYELTPPMCGLQLSKLLLCGHIFHNLKPKLLQTRTNWMQERVFSFLGCKTMFQEIKTEDLNCRSDDLSASSKCEGRRKHGHESNEPGRILLEACNRGPKCSNDQPLINHHSGSGWLPLRVFQVHLGSHNPF